MSRLYRPDKLERVLSIYIELYAGTIYHSFIYTRRERETHKTIASGGLALYLVVRCLPPSLFERSGEPVAACFDVCVFASGGPIAQLWAVLGHNDKQRGKNKEQ